MDPVIEPSETTIPGQPVIAGTPGRGLARQPATQVGRAETGAPSAPTAPAEPVVEVQLEERLEARRRHPSGRQRYRSRRVATAPPPPMGYQPGLDGLRALSVIVIMAYHGGFAWIHGGFFAVEIFFAVSGFLITALLLEERERTARVALGEFWRRRARRLLPALAATLVVVAVVTLVAGTDAQRAGLRRDVPWAVLYAGNWGQIVGDVPYYSGDPPLLRHLWTLAIEEQFYLLWPLAFLALAKVGRAVAVRLLLGAALASMALAFWLHAGGPGPVGGVFDGADRVNFIYLSTGTRAGALLLGAAAAFVWRPWRSAARLTPAVRARLTPVLDHTGAVALAVFGCVAATAVLTEGYVYQWLMPMMTVLAVVLVLVVVHPAATGMRRAMGWKPLVEIGRRSYGLYLWHWPAFVFAGATDGSVVPFVAAMVVTVVVSEACYRFVETPVRTGDLARWWGRAGSPRMPTLAIGMVGVVVLVWCYTAVAPYDRAVGGEEAVFTPPPPTAPTAAGSVPPAVAPAAPGAPPAAPAPVSTAAPTPTPPPTRRVTVVGDSQAHSLAVNLPDGIEETFTINNGSVPGCSVYDAGRVRSRRTSFTNSFAMCEGWQDTWAGAAQGADADVALVVLGAWDVFDLETGDGTWLVFGTPEWDAYVAENLQSGIDALTAVGTRVALLEAACMRPQQVDGAAVPPLPERGEDLRIAHVNELFRQVAASNADTTSFVEGPGGWCDDEAVATDLGLRWDGVHLYGPGAAMVFDAIAPALIDI